LERLEGWWFRWCIQHLVDKSLSPMALTNLHREIVRRAEEFQEENLPVDLWDDPEAVDVDSDTRVFVLQLREIGLTNNAIEHAVRNYYRAFTNRSRWNREDLLLVGELEDYERRLVEEWEQFFALMHTKLGDSPSEELMREKGFELYQTLQLNRHIAIRAKVTEQSIYRGSLHILADDQKIGWHSSFKERLQVLLGVASE